jgi:hypothetical protein
VHGDDRASGKDTGVPGRTRGLYAAAKVARSGGSRPICCSAIFLIVDHVDVKVPRLFRLGRAHLLHLFAIVADPTRHREVDGSATVHGNIRAPAEFVVGARFSTRMRMYGVPYRITGTVTRLVPDMLIEWRHPVGHHWRWEFEAFTNTDPRHRDVRLPRHRSGQGRAEVLRAHRFRQAQCGRDRGNPVQATRSVRVAFLRVDGHQYLGPNGAAVHPKPDGRSARLRRGPQHLPVGKCLTCRAPAVASQGAAMACWRPHFRLSGSTSTSTDGGVGLNLALERHHGDVGWRADPHRRTPESRATCDVQLCVSHG